MIESVHDVPDGASQASEPLLAAALAAIADPVVVTDARAGGRGPRVLWANAAFTRLSGWSTEELEGRPVAVLSGPATDAAALALAWQAAAAGEPHDTQTVGYTREGNPFVLELSVSPVRDRAGAVTHLVVVARDVTADRARVALLERRARTDPLTGLGNRRLLQRELTSADVAPGRSRRAAGLLMIDVDHFKEINDRHGHEVGDAVLTEIAHRIAGVLRGQDVVSRWGGEEFCALLPGVRSDAELLDVAERVRAAVADSPIPTPAGPAWATVSVGAARTHGDVGREDLVGLADEALYEAKEAGRNRVGIAPEDEADR